METCFVGFTPDKSIRLEHIHFKNILMLMNITSQENLYLYIKISTYYDRKTPSQTCTYDSRKKQNKKIPYTLIRKMGASFPCLCLAFLSMWHIENGLAHFVSHHFKAKKHCERERMKTLNSPAKKPHTISLVYFKYIQA